MFWKIWCPTLRVADGRASTRPDYLTKIELKTEVKMFRSSHLYTFVKASTNLSKVVASLYPYANPSSGRFRKRSIYAAGHGDRGGRRGGRFLMSEVVAEDMEEEVDKVEEDTSKEAVEGAAVHMKMELMSHVSPVTLKIPSGPQYQTIQGKGSLSTRYAQSSLQIKIGAPPDLSVMERTTSTS